MEKGKDEFVAFGVGFHHSSGEPSVFLGYHVPGPLIKSLF